MPESESILAAQEAYAEALKRIEKCRREGRTSLNLKELELTHLPAEIGQLASLEVLFLPGNQLSSLPAEIGQLASLKVLYLSANQLSSLPAEIGQLANLTSLYLSANQLSSLPAEIGQLANLTSLDFSDNQLSSLPAEIGQLANLRKLDLSNNQLSSLPAEIGQLANLTSLYLSHNQLSSLSAEIGQLGNLTSLDLSENQLSTLPSEIGQLANLTSLYLSDNQLSSLPADIGQLANLTKLYLFSNEIRSLPAEIGQLANLRELYLSANQLTILPEVIGQLANLTKLDFSGNQLSSLPAEVVKMADLRDLSIERNQFTTLPVFLAFLPRLKSLRVHGNPLPAEFLRLSGGSRGAGTKLLKFLRSLAIAKASGGADAPRQFNEAKVLLVGQGEVGKTWLLAALQGNVPGPTRPTKGIEIAREPLRLAHPADAGRTLHLNCWDFGGQDHFQITHQIFFSAKAVYLLVWKPRTGFDPELIDRLERIQLSAGRTAKVLIVSTHADGNVPAIIGKDALKERFGDLIWGFYEVDSANGPAGTGISMLQREISLAAAQLEGMEIEYLPAWHDVRDVLLALKQPTIEFRQFAAACVQKGLDATSAADLAAIMEIHGHAVYFADAADDAEAGMNGDNLVVLDPEWLAKAIGFVIEDKQTIQTSGVLKHSRLAGIWKEDLNRDCPGYPRPLHGYLLWLMWKFDIAYKQDDHTSLIPQHIVRDRPDDLYWTPTKPTHQRQAVLICRMPHDAPAGMIPALTAAVHPLRRIRDPNATDRLDRNWRDGFFLDTALRGSAFVELQDRELKMVVRDAYPSNLSELVRKTLEEITELRWPKLDMDYRVRCMGKAAGKDCKGTFRKSSLEGRRGLPVYCEDCGHDNLDADKMLDGFDAREEDLLKRLRELTHGQKDLIATAHTLFKSLDPENWELERAPTMFTILPEKGKNWFTNATQESTRVTCWCEHPDGPHPGASIGSGTPPDYILKMPQGWLVKASPYITWAATLLKAFIPLGGTLTDQTFGQLPDINLKDEIALMNDAAKAIPTGKLEVGERHRLEESIHRSRPEIVALRHIHDALLSQVKPAQRWGDLRPVQTKSGQILWLCARHAAIQQPPVQDL